MRGWRNSCCVVGCMDEIKKYNWEFIKGETKLFGVCDKHGN